MTYAEWEQTLNVERMHTYLAVAIQVMHGGITRGDDRQAYVGAKQAAHWATVLGVALTAEIVNELILEESQP